MFPGGHAFLLLRVQLHTSSSMATCYSQAILLGNWYTQNQKKQSLKVQSICKFCFGREDDVFRILRSDLVGSFSFSQVTCTHLLFPPHSRCATSNVVDKVPDDTRVRVPQAAFHEQNTGFVYQHFWHQKKYIQKPRYNLQGVKWQPRFTIRLTFWTFCPSGQSKGGTQLCCQMSREFQLLR